MTRATHFIADLHLDNDQEPAACRLAAYLAGAARQADALYVLGDLFEVWIGDDGSLARHTATLTAFSALVEHGVTVYFQRGNRDFAVGPAFISAGQIQILDDPIVIDLYGTPTLLTHGDLLCSDDVAHQRFRARYTNPRWRTRMLALPLWLRRVIARRARARSAAGKQRLAADIMDVNNHTVGQIMRRHGATRIIHGHTHRPADYRQAAYERHVIADWRPEQTQVLVASADGVSRHTIAADGTLD